MSSSLKPVDDSVECISGDLRETLPAHVSREPSDIAQARDYSLVHPDNGGMALASNFRKLESPLLQQLA